MAHERFILPVGQSLDREQLRGYVHPLVQDGGNDEGCLVHDDIGGAMVLDLVKPEQGRTDALVLPATDARINSHAGCWSWPRLPGWFNCPECS